MTLPRNHAGEKIGWQGVLLSVQPRIRLTRSFDQRSHTYLGYTLKGVAGSEVKPENFSSGWGKARTPNTTFGPGTRYPVMRCRFRIRDWRRLNSTRSAT